MAPGIIAANTLSKMVYKSMGPYICFALKYPSGNTVCTAS